MVTTWKKLKMIQIEKIQACSSINQQKKGLGVTCFVKHGKVVEVDMSDARFTTSK